MNNTNIKLDGLFTTLGYSVSVWRGQATTQLQKKLGLSKEEAQEKHILTEDQAKSLLTQIANSKSKYKTNASDLLTNGFENLLCDENYTSEKLSKTALRGKKSSVKKDHITIDLKEFIETISSLEEFEKFRANKYQA